MLYVLNTFDSMGLFERFCQLLIVSSRRKGDVLAPLMTPFVFRDLMFYVTLFEGQDSIF